MEIIWLIALIALIFSAGVIVGVIFHAVLASKYEQAVGEVDSLRNRVIALEKEAASKITAVKKVL